MVNTVRSRNIQNFLTSLTNMSNEEYQRERTRLLEVLKDATDRGDYYLEMDVMELLRNLQQRYYEEE